VESSGLWTYPAIFAALVAAGFGAPLPEEIPIVTAGVLCAKAASPDPVPAADWTAALALPGAQGNPALAAASYVEWSERDSIPRPRRHPVWWIMLPVCIIGVVVCDGLLYFIGRFGGPHLVESRWFQKYVLKPTKRATIESNFHKFGVRLLLGVRLLPGIRAPVFVMAGVVRLPTYRFLLADGIYALPVVTVLFTLAYWFTDSVVQVVDNLERRVGSLKHYLVIGGIAAFAAWMAYEFWKRWVVTGDPKEVPLIGKKVIKPTPELDDAGDEGEAMTVIEQQIVSQSARQVEQVEPQRPKADDAPENRSLKSYLVAGVVVMMVACWTVYRSARRRGRRD
jgi:membrane protein DedA with SNARE-associated domain